MTPSSGPADRVIVDGKFFRLNGEKFPVKGLTYGPFAPNASGDSYPEPTRIDHDLELIRDLGANVLRLYEVPPPYFLDRAQAHGLKLLIDIPWPKHLCFLDTAAGRETGVRAVREAVTACRRHPAVFAYSVVNEIPADIVRWSGVRRITSYLDELIDEARSIDPDALYTFASFPPTEFLRPRNIDFLCFNVYLHHAHSYEIYLDRLQTLADSKPLMLGEFGIDSFRETEDRKCDILRWQIEGAFRNGLAGTVVFSFTDDWFRGGYQIEDWAFGLTNRDRKPKPSFAVVQEAFHHAPRFPLPRTPRVSVVVASYNGARTLKACLDSLLHLHYPDYEVILVDDGSTDNTPAIAAGYDSLRYIRQDNCGLSVARNTGIAAATGEIVAFTDSDCRADEDWLHYLVGDLIRNDWSAVGGHNFLPPEDSPIAAAVMVSPGGPAHVMVTDRVAEHVPGCNMAFYKWALEEIGGFDPVFHKAGDDVDVCWRLQEHGSRIGFSPAGFVWHYRRSTIRAYLRQQGGYGEAEALLARKHPEYFNSFGGGVWRGRIYTAAKPGVLIQRPFIYHGAFATGFFQKLYSPEPAFALMVTTSLEYHVLVTLPLAVLSASFPWLLPLAVTSLTLSCGVCAIAAAQADLPPRQSRVWSRPLVALLFFLQPIVRGWARHKWRLSVPARPETTHERLDQLTRADHGDALDSVAYWSPGTTDRLTLLKALLKRLDHEGWQNKTDSGWSPYDVEVSGSPWCRLRLLTASEELAGGKLNLRCRLRGHWSLLARLCFWSLFLLQSAAIALLASWQPWIWLILLDLPLLAWFFDHEKRTLQLLVLNLLDTLADELQLIRTETPPRAELVPVAP